MVETDMLPQCDESNVSRISDVIDARVNQNFLVVIGKKDTIWPLSSYMFVSCCRAETPTSLLSSIINKATNTCAVIDLFKRDYIKNVKINQYIFPWQPPHIETTNLKLPSMNDEDSEWSNDAKFSI